jgi:hypothetical protein
MIAVFTTRKKIRGAMNAKREERIVAEPRAINKSPR